MPKVSEPPSAKERGSAFDDILGAKLPGTSGVLDGKWRPLRSVAWMIALLVVLVALLSLQSIVRTFTTNSTAILAMAFVTAGLSYGIYALLVCFAERRTVSELALAFLPRELLVGIAIGAGIMAATIGLLRLIGVYDISPGLWTDWPHDIREALGTGFLEELLARLVIFRLLASAFGVKPALILSAALFGAAHFFNPGATLSSTIAIAVEAGLTLAGFYLLTGRIWMSVGVHAGWNFTLGAIFGARVSGMQSEGSLLVSVPRGAAPSWLSGGSFGPEASLVAVAIGLAVFLLTLRTHRRSRALPA